MYKFFMKVKSLLTYTIFFSISLFWEIKSQDTDSLEALLSTTSYTKQKFSLLNQLADTVIGSKYIKVNPYLLTEKSNILLNDCSFRFFMLYEWFTWCEPICSLKFLCQNIYKLNSCYFCTFKKNMIWILSGTKIKIH